MSLTVNDLTLPLQPVDRHVFQNLNFSFLKIKKKSFLVAFLSLEIILDHEPSCLIEFFSNIYFFNGMNFFN